MHGHFSRTDRCDTCRDWPEWVIELIVRLDRMETVMTEFANDQAHLDADVQAISQQFATAIAELKAQIAAGVPAEQLNFAAADALVSTVTAEATADAPPAAPAPVDAPPADGSTPPVEGGDASTPTA